MVDIIQTYIHNINILALLFMAIIIFCLICPQISLNRLGEKSSLYEGTLPTPQLTSTAKLTVIDTWGEESSCNTGFQEVEMYGTRGKIHIYNNTL